MILELSLSRSSRSFLQSHVLQPHQCQIYLGFQSHQASKQGFLSYIFLAAASIGSGKHRCKQRSASRGRQSSDFGKPMDLQPVAAFGQKLVAFVLCINLDLKHCHSC